MSVPSTAATCPNLLLSRLPESDYHALRPYLELFKAPAGTVLFERGQQIEAVYFPLSGAHSVLAVMEDGAAVEVGTIGNEGFSIVDVLTGSTKASETTICQIPGESLRMPIDRFRQAIAASPTLRHLAYRFLQGYLGQVSQSVACNRLHSTEQRFARWILISHDRVQGDTFHITQEFLADMLGVHRPSVSVIARSFQLAGLIKYQRGAVTILDRKGIEKACCECYEVVKRQFATAIGKGVG